MDIKVYANLLGKWVCLNDDPNCRFGGEDYLTVNQWIEKIDWSFQTFLSDVDFVRIEFKGKTFIIHKSLITIQRSDTLS